MQANNIDCPKCKSEFCFVFELKTHGHISSNLVKIKCENCKFDAIELKENI